MKTKNNFLLKNFFNDKISSENLRHVNELILDEEKHKYFQLTN